MQCPECGQGPCPKCGRAYDLCAHPEIDCPWCEIDRLRADLKTALDAASSGVGWWVWQGDGEDHVESLTCPILIRAEQMREVQAEIDRLRAIVDKLPTDAEGQPIAPGDRRYHKRLGYIEIIAVSKPDDTHDCRILHGGREVGVDGFWFYSTREAAEKANEEKPPG